MTHRRSGYGRSPGLFGAMLGLTAALACGRIDFDAVTAPGDGRSDSRSDTVLGVDTSSVGCPTTYQVVSGQAHRYRYLGPTDYPSGVAACQADGTLPAVIDDASEAAALNALTPFGSAWTGVVGAGSQWMTATGAVATYLPWAPTEPVNTGTGVCVELYPTDLSFRTEPVCTNQWFMFCECVP